MYRLKANQPPFEVVDGPAVGQKFAHGFVYPDLPAGESHRFEPMDPPEPALQPEKTADQPTRKGGRKEEVADA